MAEEFIARPQTLFGKLPYRYEQKALDAALLDTARGLAMTIPEEFQPGDLPITEELGFALELAPEFVRTGKISDETRRQLAIKFFCRAKSKLGQIF